MRVFRGAGRRVSEETGFSRQTSGSMLFPAMIHNLSECTTRFAACRGFPGGGRQFLPLHSVGRMPDVVAVAALRMIALHHPQPIVPGGDVAILPREPGNCCRRCCQ